MFELFVLILGLRCNIIQQIQRDKKKLKTLHLFSRTKLSEKGGHQKWIGQAK